MTSWCLQTNKPQKYSDYENVFHFCLTNYDSTNCKNSYRALLSVIWCICGVGPTASVQSLPFSTFDVFGLLACASSQNCCYKIDKCFSITPNLSTIWENNMLEIIDAFAFASHPRLTSMWVYSCLKGGAHAVVLSNVPVCLVFVMEQEELQTLRKLITQTLVE